ncbi:MAG: hypothetical protein A2328_00590, partial [Bdellovibrionales bacterium RIFOXYB2_FULL_36_6]
MYNHVVFEISGKCNALCPWCATGIESHDNSNTSKQYITCDEFKKAVFYLKKNNVITADAYFFLYNWGEPMLNPQFGEIAAFLNDEGHEYIVSTNASRPLYFENEQALRNLRSLVFSMSGFSQNSYDRIHGFSFHKIKDNIVQMLDNYRRCGFRGKAEIRYHVYQFNIDEIPDMLAFAKEQNLCVSPTYAGIADLRRLKAYLANEMPYDELKKLSQDLIFYYPEQVKKQVPPSYTCPYHEVLFIDEKSRLLTCCMMTKEMSGYAFGDLYDYSYEEMKKAKKCQSFCKECMQQAIPYLINNRPYPKIMDILDVKMDFYDPDRPLLIWGTEKMATVLYDRLVKSGIQVSGFIECERTEKKCTLLNKSCYLQEQLRDRSEFPSKP